VKLLLVVGRPKTFVFVTNNLYYLNDLIMAASNNGLLCVSVMHAKYLIAFL
jgi:hypothetical protein